MYINNINTNNKETIYQVISAEFKGIGKIEKHTEAYTVMMPHNDKEIEKDWPESGVTYKVYIPTKDITLIIVLKDEHKES